METILNPPQVGVCGYCGRPSVRLLNAPLLSVPERITRPYEGGGNRVWVKFWSAPADICDVVEREGDHLIVLASEAVAERKYCFRCFDGHVSPPDRDYCINLPREMHFTANHPWWPARWVSEGRELARQRNVNEH